VGVLHRGHSGFSLHHSAMHFLQTGYPASSRHAWAMKANASKWQNRPEAPPMPLHSKVHCALLFSFETQPQCHTAQGKGHHNHYSAILMRARGTMTMC